MNRNQACITSQIELLRIFSQSDPRHRCPPSSGAPQIMMSGKLLGVIFGVILNEMLPKLLLIIFMVLILSYSGMRTIRKGLKAYAKETEEMERKKVDNGDSETVVAGSNGDQSGKNAAG